MSDQVLAEINCGEMKGLTFAAVRNKKHKDIFIKCKNEPTVPAQSYDSNVIGKEAGEEFARRSSAPSAGQEG